MTMNLQISLLSLTLSSAAVIGSIFGMNLWSGLEHHHLMFYIVVAIMPMVGLSIYTIFQRYYRGRTQQFAEMTRTALSSNIFDKFNSANYVRKMTKETDKEEFRKIILEIIGKECISQDEIEKILDEIQSFDNRAHFPEELFEEEKKDLYGENTNSKKRT